MSRSINVNVDTKTFVRFWIIIAILIIFASLFSIALPALIIIGIALFFAVALMPLVKKIDKKFHKNRSKPGLSAGLVVGGLAVVILAVVAIVGPVVLRETAHFVSTAPEQIQHTISSWDGLNEIGNSFGIHDAKTQIINLLKDWSQSFLSSFPTTVLSSVGTIVNFLTATILVIALTILFITQGPQVLNSFLSVIDNKNGRASKICRKLVNRFADVISRYVTGQLTVAILDGLVVGISVFVITILFGISSGLAIPMAMIAAIFYLIPLFGPIITAITVSMMLFFSNPWAGLSFLIFYIVYEQIENNVIAPRIQGNSMNLPPLIILISIVLGMYMFGLLGAIISIPIAGIVKVLIESYPEIKAIKNASEQD
ncbi:AI-2E family transporter [Candidatus Saccharibacteria bacterium]|nr:AI-2E family transporter [Candidatus Saccharibacteria bacterium]